MKIKELLELNNCIGDLDVEIRDENAIYIKSYHIGLNSGIEPIQRPPLCENDVYKEVSINSFDTKRVYYQILLNKIPKQLLELEVFSWRSYEAFRRDYSCELERVLIEVRGVNHVEIKEECLKNDAQLSGQMEITDFPEVMP